MVEKSVILFDGVCNLCTGSVQFIIRRDLKHQFQFGSLQSSKAQDLLKAYQYDATELSTLILIEAGRLYTRSAAALHIARKLGGGWAIFYPLIFLPSFFRDWLYDLVARNRYKIFGKRSACLIPRPEWKDRFID